MPSKPIPIRFDTDLLERIDKARGDEARAAWVKEACERRLGKPKVAKPKKTVEPRFKGRTAKKK